MGDKEFDYIEGGGVLIKLIQAGILLQLDYAAKDKT